MNYEEVRILEAILKMKYTFGYKECLSTISKNLEYKLYDLQKKIGKMIREKDSRSAIETQRFSLRTISHYICECEKALRIS